MSVKTEAVTVTDTTDWSELLDEAATAPVRLERNGVVYRLAREGEDIWANYDPERIREGLRLFADTFTLEEGEQLKELIYRAREEGTRPINRP